jgi:hypothetical protein
VPLFADVSSKFSLGLFDARQFFFRTTPKEKPRKLVRHFCKMTARPRQQTQYLRFARIASVASGYGHGPESAAQLQGTYLRLQHENPELLHLITECGRRLPRDMPFSPEDVSRECGNQIVSRLQEELSRPAPPLAAPPGSAAMFAVPVFDGYYRYR